MNNLQPISIIVKGNNEIGYPPYESKLARISALMGPNGSGKTKFLQEIANYMAGSHSAEISVIRLDSTRIVPTIDFPTDNYLAAKGITES